MPKTHTSSNNQPSFFFGDYEVPSLTIGELESPLGEPPKIFDEPIGEEETIEHAQTMDENWNNEFFPIKETNGEARMNN